MSKRDRKDAESQLPQGEFILSTGSNYGMDGFDFDTPYDEGKNNGQDSSYRLPGSASSGMSSLPGDMMASDHSFPDIPASALEEEGVGDITEMMKEGSLVGLGWLHGEQDPSRLPHETHNTMIPELEEAWGTLRRTDGLGLVPNIDPEIADYEHVARETPKKATREELARVVQRAMRRSAYGEPLRDILKQAAEDLGPANVNRVLKAMQQVKAEHGLAGKVFIRASAFPGLSNGKWKQEIRKKCTQAIYVIDKQGSGVGDVIKKEVVQSIPWNVALGHYTTLLQAAGHKVAAKGHPRDILKAAFLSEPTPVKTHIDRDKPIQVMPSDQVTKAQAWEDFKAASKPVREVVNLMERQAEEYRQKVQLQIAKWAKKGLIRTAEAKRLVQSPASPHMILRAAASIIFSFDEGAYSGGEGLSVVKQYELWPDAKTAFSELAASEQQAVEDQKIAELAARTTFEAVNKLVQGGLLTNGEGSKLLAKKLTTADCMKYAFAIISKRSQLKGAVAATPKAREYIGAGNRGLNRPVASDQQAAQALANHQDPTARAMGVLSERDAMLLNGQLRKVMAVGLITEGEASRLKKLGKGLNETLKLVGAIIAKRAALKGEVVVKTPEKADYRGAGERAIPKPKEASDEARRQLKASKPKVSANELEIRQMVRWASQEMNGGVAGSELDALLQARFSTKLRDAAKDRIAALREKHEGLAGFLYVDASSYASPEGTKGCEEGGLRHRANGLKYVLAMKRCSGCTLRNADEICQKYNKELVQAAPVEDRKAYQEKSIRLADAPDHEVTASLFDPNEFNLNNSELEGMNVEDAPEYVDVGDIFFGGIELG